MTTKPEPRRRRGTPISDSLGADLHTLGVGRDEDRTGVHLVGIDPASRQVAAGAAVGDDPGGSVHRGRIAEFQFPDGGCPEGRIPAATIRREDLPGVA